MEPSREIKPACAGGILRKRNVEALPLPFRKGHAMGHMLPTYQPKPVIFERGAGAWSRHTIAAR